MKVFLINQATAFLTSVSGHNELISCGQVKAGIVSRLIIFSQLKKIGDPATPLNAQEPRRRAVSSPREKRKKSRKKVITLDSKQLKITGLLDMDKVDK